MKRLYFKANSQIISEGDLGDCAYIVETGRLEVSKINEQNNRQVLGQLKENDIFGELGLIDGLPRSATVKALGNCTIKVLTKESFNSLMAKAQMIFEMSILRLTYVPPFKHIDGIIKEINSLVGNSDNPKALIPIFNVLTSRLKSTLNLVSRTPNHAQI